MIIFASWLLLCAVGSPDVKTFDEAYKLASSRELSAGDSVRLTKWLGNADLSKGLDPRSEDLRFIFAIKSDGNQVTAQNEDGSWKLKLARSGDTFFGAASFAEMTAFRWRYIVDGKKIGGGELEAYTYPAETRINLKNPQGKLTEQAPWRSKVFAGTTRQWWIYVPAQYDPAKPANLAVVQDGQWARNYWVTVLDNMIATKDIPVTIAVFLTPGTIAKPIDNRSVEYDTVSDKYVTMLADEILPELYKSYNIKRNPESHLIAGASSGGICAFNAAWHRPDLFRRVVSWIGSFTNLQGGPTGVAGGNTYPAIIRDRRGWDQKGEPKPIRVFLQDGANDVDNKAGNWPLANQEMARALAFGGYDFRFDFGNGFHSDKHGHKILPSQLRWLWRDEPN